MGRIKTWFRYTPFLAFVIDIIALLISFISLESVSSSFFYKILYCIKSIRFELIVILLAVCIWIVIRYIFARQSPFLNVFMVCALVYTGLVAEPLFVSLAKGRYYYYNERLYQMNLQSYPLEHANNAFNRKEYSRALEQYKLALEVSPHSRVNKTIEQRMNSITQHRSIAEKLFDQLHINGFEQRVSVDQLNTLYFCYYLTNDLFYKDHIDYYEKIIRDAIANYAELYDACQNTDNQRIMALYNEYGWCFFEPGQQLYIEEYKNHKMRRLTEFVLSEDCNRAQIRLKESWLYKGETYAETLY